MDELVRRALAALGVAQPPAAVSQFRAEEDGMPYNVWKVTWPERTAVLKRTTAGEREVYETFFGPGGGPVPAIYGFAEMDSQLYMLMEYVEGETLSRCTREKLIPALDALIETQERFWGDTGHEKVGYCFDICYKHREKRLPYMGDLSGTYRAYLKAFSSAPRTLCNDDLLPFNVVVSGGRAVLLDWEYAGILPWPCALARLLAFGEESEEGQLFVMTEADRQFALGYYFTKLIAKKGISRAEFERTMKLFFFKEYSEWIYCVGSAGEKDDNYEKNLAKARRLARELSELD